MQWVEEFNLQISILNQRKKKNLQPIFVCSLVFVFLFFFFIITIKTTSSEN